MLDYFASEAIEGLRLLFELLLIMAHFFEGRQEEDFCLAAVVDEDFGDIPSIDVDSMDRSIGMRERS
jgi:hypothetical protein